MGNYVSVGDLARSAPDEYAEAFFGKEYERYRQMCECEELLTDLERLESSARAQELRSKTELARHKEGQAQAIRLGRYAEASGDTLECVHHATAEALHRHYADMLQEILLRFQSPIPARQDRVLKAAKGGVA